MYKVISCRSRLRQLSGLAIHASSNLEIYVKGPTTQELSLVVMLCYAYLVMSFNALRCHAVQCHVMPCHVIQCHVMPGHDLPWQRCRPIPCTVKMSYTMTYRAVSCRAMTCHTLSWQTTQCHVMSTWLPMPCYVMPYHDLPYFIVILLFVTGCLVLLWHLKLCYVTYLVTLR